MLKGATQLSRDGRGFFRTIGHYRNERGRRVPRKFRLGYDKSKAVQKAQSLSRAWEELPGYRGQKVWTDEAVEAALRRFTPPSLVAPVSPASPPLAAPPVFPPKPFLPPTADVAVYSLPAALDEFCRYFSGRTDAGQLHRDGTAARIASITQHIEDIFVEQPDGSRLWLRELPVVAMDMEWLSRIRNRITGRPLTKHAYDTPKRISIDTVKNWLMALGMAFDWFDRTPRIGWAAPHPRWREQFTLNRKQVYALQTPEERDEQGRPKPCFTVDELAQIYRNSSRLGQKYLLMGLFLGWSQEAICSFRRPHLVQIGGDYYIDRRRGKTGVNGYWWVCPELAEALKRSMAKTSANADDLAFLTEDRHPLVHGKTDTIRLTCGSAVGHQWHDHTAERVPPLPTAPHTAAA